jgi:glycosyltransferase involved in cell wall biosynthesis
VDLADCAKTRNPIRAVSRLYDLLEKHRPDLVLTYNWGSIDAVIAALLRRIPVIHTEDGFGNEEAVRQKRRRVWFRRAALRHVHAVIAPSLTLSRVMRGIWRLPETHIRYIPNGVDLDLFTPPARSMNGSGEIVIGTVGQLRREKRQDLLIEACAAIKAQPIRLLLAGDGMERNALREKARALRIEDRVEFLGAVSAPEQLYRKLDIFALSSSTEQMPMSVLEAMATGLPVLSTDVGDVKHIVSADNQPYVVAWDAYPAALNRLVEDAALRRELGAGNRKKCEQLYGFDRMLEQYERVYESALAASAPAKAPAPGKSQAPWAPHP